MMDIILDKVPAFSALLATAQNITVITHLGPDGDAIGSATAMGQALTQLGKRVTLRCDHPVPDHLSFIPWSDKIVVPEDEQPAEADLLVVVDCGDAGRMGESFKLFADPVPPIVNIDHHPTNPNFGVVNMVGVKATSVAEILAGLLPALNITIDKNIATSLLTGLVTDSLGFRIAATTADTIRAASLLMEAGANLSEITDRALSIHPLSSLKLYGLGLSRMKFQDGFLWTAVPYTERQKLGENVKGTGGLVSMLGYTTEAKMGCVLSEIEDGTVRVSFRSRKPWNVAAVATSFGGGGHLQAAGCSIDMSLAEAEVLVVKRALAEIKRQSG